MSVRRGACRLCLTESEFSVPLFGSFSRRTNMPDKILVCLKIVVEESDSPNTVCYKCANKIETYYEFVMSVKKSQTKLGKSDHYDGRREPSREERSPAPVNRRQVTSYVREQVFDGDYTFAFLDISNVEEKESKASSPFFSYFSPADVKKQPEEPAVWKTPQSRCDARSAKVKREGARRKPCSGRRLSGDLFASQSQEGAAEPPGTFDWKLAPDNLLKIVKEKCFGRSDF